MRVRIDCSDPSARPWGREACPQPFANAFWVGASQAFENKTGEMREMAWSPRVRGRHAARERTSMVSFRQGASPDLFRTHQPGVAPADGLGVETPHAPVQQRLRAAVDAVVDEALQVFADLLVIGPGELEGVVAAQHPRCIAFGLYLYSALRLVAAGKLVPDRLYPAEVLDVVSVLVEDHELDPDLARDAVLQQPGAEVQAAAIGGTVHGGSLHASTRRVRRGTLEIVDGHRMGGVPEPLEHWRPGFLCALNPCIHLFSHLRHGIGVGSRGAVGQIGPAEVVDRGLLNRLPGRVVGVRGGERIEFLIRDLPRSPGPGFRSRGGGGRRHW